MSWQRGWGEAARGSDAVPASARGRMVTLSQGELMDMEQNAKARAHRAFAYACVIGAVLGLSVGVGATRAFGETITIGGLYINGQQQPGTTVTIEPSTDPGQIAVVTMVNAHVNDAGDNGEYFIAIPGLAVGVTFTWDADGFSGSDQMTIRPPEGIECIPADCAASVMEGFTGRVVLLDWVGM